MKYLEFIDYYAKLTEQEIQEYRERYFSEEGETMGLAQLLRQEGKQEGEAIMLLRLLEKRFGTVPEALARKGVPSRFGNFAELVRAYIDQ